VRRVSGDWETTGDVGRFLEVAGAFLRARPVEHTALLTVSEMVSLRGPNVFGDEAPRFGWWNADGAVAGAFVHTPPYGVLLGPAPAEAAVALVDTLADRPLTGANGPTEVAQPFADAYPAPARERRRECLYRLGELIEPPAIPGRAVVATAAHRPVLIEWYDAFAREVGETAHDWSALVDDRLGHQGLHVWETEEDGVVGLAGSSRRIAGMMRISPVYTPPEQRGRGIAAALTAAVARFARAEGADEIVLFADVANPTSNRVYQRIGFAPVDERLVVDF
jgi:predicted GNAT family acetyltransferase